MFNNDYLVLYFLGTGIDVVASYDSVSNATVLRSDNE